MQSLPRQTAPRGLLFCGLIQKAQAMETAMAKNIIGLFAWSRSQTEALMGRCIGALSTPPAPPFELAAWKIEQVAYSYSESPVRCTTRTTVRAVASEKRAIEASFREGARARIASATPMKSAAPSFSRVVMASPERTPRTEARIRMLWALWCGSARSRTSE